MFRSRSRLVVPAILGLALACSAGAEAGFIGDTATARVFFPEFALDVTGSAVVASPGLEFDDFGADFASNGPQFDINIEDQSIEIIVNGFFGISTSPATLFRGLEFTGLNAGNPAAAITGFTLDVSPSLAGVFGPDRISFGPDFVHVNFNDGTYFAGDRVTLNLQLTPTAVPEPSSLAMLGAGALGLLGYGWRRRQAARA